MHGYSLSVYEMRRLVTSTLISAVFVAFFFILASNYKSPTDTYIRDAQPKVISLSLSHSLCSHSDLCVACQILITISIHHPLMTEFAKLLWVRCYLMNMISRWRNCTSFKVDGALWSGWNVFTSTSWRLEWFKDFRYVFCWESYVRLWFQCLLLEF